MADVVESVRETVETEDGSLQGVSVDTTSGVDKTTETVDVRAIDAETKAGGTGFDPLRDELGDIEELKLDGYYKDLNPDHIREILAEPKARSLFHNLRVALKVAETKAAEKVTAAEQKVAQREAELNRQEKALHAQLRQFNAIAKNPEIQKLLTTHEGELPDALTPEGIEARVTKKVAEAMKGLLEPMAKAAEQEEAAQSYMDWLDAHAEVRSDPTFKAEMAKMVRERAEAKAPITRDDAYLIVRANRIAAAENARQATIERARQESARRVAASTSSGQPGNDDVPREVVRRGAIAVAEWLNQNPQARARYEREAGIR